MAYEVMTNNQDVTAVDIQNMRDMSIQEYNEYLPSLIYVDHHEILRSMPAGYPLAVTAQQAKALLVYLQSLASQVGES